MFRFFRPTAFFKIMDRGRPTEKFVQSFFKLNDPCKVIMTLNKIFLKHVISTLKFPVSDMLQSNVVYKIIRSRCQSSYVGQM